MTMYSNLTKTFYFDDDKNKPSDCVFVSDDDHIKAINLPQGCSFTFAVKQSGPAVLISAPPAQDFILSRAKEQQIEKIDASYVASNNAPISYMGTTFQADSGSQSLLTSVISASCGSLPPGFVWYDINNSPQTMSYQQLQGLAESIFLRGQHLFLAKQAKKAAIRSATTVDQVMGVLW